RLKPDSRKLIAAALALPGAKGLHVLAPPDMVLHSMTHLFHNEELSHGLRDLSDLDRLLRHFATATAFWDDLVARADELDLARPLYYGLRHTQAILGTPVPAETFVMASRAAPGWPLGNLMEGLWSRALRSPHSLAADRLTPATLFMLYLRAHWLRMPPLLLLRHLGIKALRRGETDPQTP
ncbi:MAG: nucleotidyltransferase family protein, partial [Burkholderiaceae bacterium]